MDWLTGGKQGEAKRLITQLSDATKRDEAARELIGLGADAVPTLIEALQTKDSSLLPIYQHLLARIPSASGSPSRCPRISLPCGTPSTFLIWAKSWMATWSLCSRT